MDVRDKEAMAYWATKPTMIITPLHESGRVNAGVFGAYTILSPTQIGIATAKRSHNKRQINMEKILLVILCFVCIVLLYRFNSQNTHIQSSKENWAPLKIHFGGQPNLFVSGRCQAKAAFASTQADLPSLPDIKNLLRAAQKQLFERPDSVFMPLPPLKPGYTITSHEVYLHHPMSNTKSPIKKYLYQILDENGIPIEYYMLVDSVSCRDDVCEVIKVRMHWDAIGQYKSFKLPIDSKLTKLDHVPFDKADYSHLETVLKDKQSILKSFNRDLFDSSNLKTDKLHGITKATPDTIQASVVQGAAYTSYGLWHWANGPIVTTIRKLTEERCDLSLLRHFLTRGKRDYILFALEYLTKKKLYDKKIIVSVTPILSGTDTILIDTVLGYLKHVISDKLDFYEILIEAFPNAGTKTRAYLLRFLSEERALPTSVYDKLIDYLPIMTEYYEIHLLLNMIEHDGYVDDTILDKVSVLLSNENYFIARRAYWYLQKQTLNDKIEKRIESFVNKYRDRLL